MDMRTQAPFGKGTSETRSNDGRNARIGPRPVLSGTLRVAIVLALGAGLAALASAQPADTPSKAVTSKDAPIAQYEGKTLTAEALVQMIRDTGFRGDLTWENVMQFGPARINGFLERAFSDKHLAAAASADKEWTEPPTVEKDYQELRDRLLLQQLFKVTVTDKVTTPSAEQMKAFYEENKEKFHVPFNFTMRHLFLSTYEDYKVKPGDTLEIVAQNVSGDKANAARILLKSTHRQPGLKEEDANKPDADSRVDIHVELKPGEELIVPMSPAKAASVKAEVDEYHKKLKDGADFKDLAAEHSQAASGGDEVTITPTKDKPMLPEIVDAVKSTEVGSFSQPFRTKHGWQIIQVVRRVEESYRSLEDVKDSIIGQVQRDVQKKLADAFIADTFKKTDLLKINLDALKEDAKPEAVVATIGTERYTRQDLLVDFPKGVAPDLTVEQVRDLLKDLGRIQRPILLTQAEKMGFDETPEVKTALANARIGLAARAYLDELQARKSKTITEDDIKKYYEENGDRFKMPRKLDLYAIGVAVDTAGATGAEESNAAREALKKKMEAWKSEIKDLDRFKELAKEHSAVKPEESGHVGEVTTAYQNGFNGTLESMKIGEVVGPVDAPDKVYLLWAASETPAGVPPFAEIKSKVAQAYQNENTRIWEQEIRKEYLGKAGYKFLLPLDAPKAPHM